MEKQWLLEERKIILLYHTEQKQWSTNWSWFEKQMLYILVANLFWFVLFGSPPSSAQALSLVQDRSRQWPGYYRQCWRFFKNRNYSKHFCQCWFRERWQWGAKQVSGASSASSAISLYQKCLQSYPEQLHRNKCAISIMLQFSVHSFFVNTIRLSELLSSLKV